MEDLYAMDVTTLLHFREGPEVGANSNWARQITHRVITSVVMQPQFIDPCRLSWCIPCIMKRRTQLYLDDDLWNLLHIQARQAGTSVSELVRRAVRGRYTNSLHSRQRAMRAWAGIWQNREDIPDSQTYVRRLRKGTRVRRLGS